MLKINVTKSSWSRGGGVSWLMTTPPLFTFAAVENLLLSFIISQHWLIQYNLKNKDCAAPDQYQRSTTVISPPPLQSIINITCAAVNSSGCSSVHLNGDTENTDQINQLINQLQHEAKGQDTVLLTYTQEKVSCWKHFTFGTVKFICWNRTEVFKYQKFKVQQK